MAQNGAEDIQKQEEKGISTELWEDMFKEVELRTATVKKEAAVKKAEPSMEQMPKLKRQDAFYYKNGKNILAKGNKFLL